MNKLFKNGIPKKLRYALCMTIIPLSSPVAVQGVLSMMPMPNEVAMPLIITFLTLAYAWCIWEIRENPGFTSSDKEMPHEEEIDLKLTEQA
jgi:hypothetical protein